MKSTTYCQHAPVMRIVQPGQSERESKRPRNRRTDAFEDAPDGTQIEIPDDAQGLDVEYALATGALVPLPCAEHSPPSTSARSAKKEDGGG